MNYIDIINDNCKNHSKIKWWPKFAFHYTDVTNAVSILDTGYLYSRANAACLNIMKNDNASRQIIDITKSRVVSKVRFYFRPLTPTQYCNEGYKHPELRLNRDKNANVPVPIFLLFDLETLLSLPGVQFSETSQAGRGTELYEGVEKFSKLNFDSIYDNSYENFKATKNYRHAEILHPNSMPIDSCIRTILCRNDLERTTFLNLLRQTNNAAFLKYRDFVKVYKYDTFEDNGFYISNCSYHENMVSVSFSDTYASKKYIERMMEKLNLNEIKPIEVTLLLKWLHSDNSILNQEIIETLVDIRNPKILTVTGLPKNTQAKHISIEIRFDNKLMCYIIQPLESSELWK